MRSVPFLSLSLSPLVKLQQQHGGQSEPKDIVREWEKWASREKKTNKTSQRDGNVFRHRRIHRGLLEEKAYGKSRQESCSHLRSDCIFEAGLKPLPAAAVDGIEKIPIGRSRAAENITYQQFPPSLFLRGSSLFMENALRLEPSP